MSTTESTSGDSRRLVKTGTPGVYKRQNADGKTLGYVAIFRAGGKQRKRYAKTLAEARAIKRASETDQDRGEFQARTNIKFRVYLSEWIDSYAGNGRRGFREGTRAEYRRLLDQYAHNYFGEKLRLVDVTPRHLAQYVAWLADEGKQGRRLADQTIANACVPMRAALATARREGLIRHNPATGLALPMREEIDEDDDEHVKALSRDQLQQLLDMTPARYKLLVLLIASTGLRVSEAIGLQRRHLHLDGSRPHLKIRRAIVKRRVEPPKTKRGKRTVPISAALVLKLRTHVAEQEDQTPDALVFPSSVNTPLDPDTMRRDFLKALLEEIGAPEGSGFHVLRHSYASLQLAGGVNVVQLSRVLGHHSAAFTLSTYVHLLPGDEAPPLDLADALKRGNAGGNVPHRIQTHAEEASAA
jgi:integrase